jgi:hypothetical protein
MNPGAVLDEEFEYVIACIIRAINNELSSFFDENAFFCNRCTRNSTNSESFNGFGCGHWIDWLHPMDTLNGILFLLSEKKM